MTHTEASVWHDRCNMARARYDEAFRTRAVALAVEHGPAEAARSVGVNAGTIRSWCSRAGVATASAEIMREARDQIILTHEARRAALAEKLLAIAEEAVEVELGMLSNSKLRDVVGARTRAIHDHQLLSGQATTRTEVASKAEALSIADEVAARRAKHAA